MQVLPTEFTERGFRYVQIARQGMVAIYTQQGANWKHVRYEVIVIRVAKEHTWPDGTVSPERETYPSSGTWGTYGWTFHGEPDARAHMARLLAEREAMTREGA